MATPITHVVLTNKIFDKHFSDKDQAKFFVGTCFPDIRYLRIIDRKLTHFHGLNIESVKTELSFNAGLKFHSLLDERREKYIIENNTYDLCPDSKFTTIALKITEERLLYKKIRDWSKFINYLENVLIEEAAFGLEEKDIKNWHQLLQKNFSQKPDKNSFREFASQIYFTEKDIQEIELLVGELIVDKKIVDIISGLYDDFDLMIEGK